MYHLLDSLYLMPVYKLKRNHPFSQDELDIHLIKANNEAAARDSAFDLSRDRVWLDPILTCCIKQRHMLLQQWLDQYGLEL